jgi:hypothetical protein
MTPMTKKEYIEQIRPLLRLAIAVHLYTSTKLVDSLTMPNQMFPLAELFLAEFEKQYKFRE